MNFVFWLLVILSLVAIWFVVNKIYDYVLKLNKEEDKNE